MLDVKIKAKMGIVICFHGIDKLTEVECGKLDCANLARLTSDFRPGSRPSGRGFGACSAAVGWGFNEFSLCNPI